MADPVSEARALLAAATPDDEQVPLAPTPLADAALIAAAPDLLARLCDEIERLRAEAYPRINSWWRHFEGGICYVTAIGVVDAGGEVIVWYIDTRRVRSVCAAKKWREHVERDGYSGPRFVEVPAPNGYGR